jgi:hypothetical protein
MTEWLTTVGQVDVALSILRGAIAGRPDDATAARLHVAAGRIWLHYAGRTAEAYQHLLAALRLDPAPEVQVPAREALAEIEALHASRFRRRRPWDTGDSR